MIETGIVILRAMAPIFLVASCIAAAVLSYVSFRDKEYCFGAFSVLASFVLVFCTVMFFAA